MSCGETDHGFQGSSSYGLCPGLIIKNKFMIISKVDPDPHSLGFVDPDPNANQDPDREG